MDVLEELRYPIGRFQPPEHIDDALLAHWLDQLEALPEKIRALAENLDDYQLETPYRDGGWTIRQLVHHIADSHHNSYIRFKWALTEDMPTIKAYDEKAWSMLHDARKAPIAHSLAHLGILHLKLVYLIRGLTKEDLGKRFIHPADGSETTLLVNVGRYAWHGNHHLAHLEGILTRKGWR